MGVVVIGAGMGGLAAAIELAATGVEVDLFEAGPRVGGKADEVLVDGVAVDTGPTLLTLPHVAAALFRAGGRDISEAVDLVRPDPAFRYHYPDRTTVDVHHAVDDTLASVAASLGPAAAEQLDAHLARARRIWEASSDYFVFGAAPTFQRILTLGPRAWWSLARIDAHKTLWDVICDDVEDERLRWLLARYATYNGSDVRTAPATLACIAWVELGLGAWGIRGGMHALATALADTARQLGVRIHLDTPVERIEVNADRAVAAVHAGRRVACEAVVCNADAAHLYASLLPESSRDAVRVSPDTSTSGWVGVFRARPQDDRVAHEVVFPEHYLDEFADLFGHHRTPRDPTIYTCALSRAHGRDTWDDGEPVFAMINAPAHAPDDQPDWKALARHRLVRSGLLDRDDRLVWQRTPTSLARRFPDTGGAIYGAASSSLFSAFRRPANRVHKLHGLYLAGGSAHPGGGVPLCLQSGRQAAFELVSDLGLSHQLVAK
ncbi:MAG: phytoene desaturase [Deltaproteobacteria bacterium]|nr:MAG: phytoene desaturase [Deltaproteobacteria bacterium]